MTSSRQILLSDLLNHNTRCEKGLDHGQGVLAWMHPPVHRLLGWATKPSSLSLSRDVWRLNQIKVISNDQIYLKGTPAFSDQATLERFPTLIDADLLNKSNEKIGLIADFVFETKTGKILYYLISRSNPNLPGTSRWKLSLDRIIDQQPGLVLCDFSNLDDIPIIRSSLRQDFLKNSKKWKEQFQKISLKVNHKLEGWLDETPWYDENDSYVDNNNVNNYDSFIDEEEEPNEYFENSYYRDHNLESNGDPWI